MQNEQSAKDSPAGLYGHADSGAFVGCLDENQAAAAIRVGFRLVAPGTEAALTAEKDIPALLGKLEAAPSGDDSGKRGR